MTPDIVARLEIAGHETDLARSGRGGEEPA